MNEHNCKEESANLVPIRIAWKKINPHTPLRLLSTPDEPIAVYYFLSGWGYPEPTYHVIIEHGDVGETDYLFITSTEFLETFGVQPDNGREKIDPGQLELKFPD